MHARVPMAPRSSVAVVAALAIALLGITVPAGGVGTETCSVDLPLQTARSWIEAAAAGDPADALARFERGEPVAIASKKFNNPRLWSDSRFFPVFPEASTNIDVQASVNGTMKTIGSIIANVDDQPETQMIATFTLDSDFACLCGWYTFHWVQIITQDDCPATVAGVVPEFPVVDTPAYGWDYMYNDLDDPPDGIQEDERVPDNWKKAEYADDVVDTLPWYETQPEEDNSFKICDFYPTDDEPGNCPDAGRTTFETYLVARPKHGAKSTFCLLAGFTWSISSAGNTGATESATDAAAAARVEAGLDEGSITGWTVQDDCGFACRPIPALSPGGLVVFGVTLLAALVWGTMRRTA